MLDKFVAAFALALFAYLEKRFDRSNTAVDADIDRKTLRLASVRLRAWVRKQDDLRPRKQPNADSGTERSEDEGVPPR
jgi:hypothetical protein